MKTIILILIAFGFHAGSTNAQFDYLVLTSKKNTKESTVEKGNHIKVYTNEENPRSGQLNLIDTAIIAVGSDTIALSDIELIVAKTSGTKTGGAIAVSAGLLAVAGGRAGPGHGLYSNGLARRKACYCKKSTLASGGLDLLFILLWSTWCHKVLPYGQ